jgi:enamine deaminase RidA (YjgF/YER057c/UK114 family)
MVRYLHTDTAPAPFSNYSQATAAPAGASLVYASGQVGVDMEGALAATEEAQHEQTWRNILAILEAHGLDADDILEVHGYVTGESGVPLFRKVRDAMLDGAKPASTLLIISGLANPDWKVEISVVAAGELS